MGDIVAGAWTAYLRAPGRWLAITVVSFVVVFALQWALGDQLDLSPDPTTEEVQDTLPAVGITIGISAVAELFTHTALLAGAFAVLAGQPLSIGAAFKIGARRFLPALAAFVIVGVAGGFLTLTIILFPLAVFFFVNWSMVVQVIVHEGEGPLRALGRSRQIVRGQWWRTFGILLAIFLLAYLASLVIGWMVGRIDQTWASAIGAGIATSISAPFVSLAQTLLYTDLRARKGERPLSQPVGEPR